MMRYESPLIRRRIVTVPLVTTPGVTTPGVTAPGVTAQMVTLLIAVVFATLAGQSSFAVQEGGRDVIERPSIQAFGGQQPPPPAPAMPYFDLFVPIYLAYQDLPDGWGKYGKPAFIEWCFCCGVHDPVALHAMIVLHDWAVRTRFDPRRGR